VHRLETSEDTPTTTLSYCIQISARTERMAGVQLERKVWMGSYVLKSRESDH
jgi:hypothetical protein